MPKIAYINKRFTPSSKVLIDQANRIIVEYQRQGFTLTLRQLYYQFVSRDLITNTVKSYKRLGGVVNDARLAGLIDWSAIEDRTREVVTGSHWKKPSDIVTACSEQYRIDKWEGQKYRPEVWIEKEALAGVIEGVCRELDIPYLSCRGYTSQSEMWGSSMRLRQMNENNQTPVILHFGDHDPSGIDMSRDIADRLTSFRADFKFARMALNMDQVEEHTPPPNPAKVTDSRFRAYQKEYGDESWELDALEPSLIVALIRTSVLEHRDEDLWAERVEEEERQREVLVDAAARIEADEE